MKTLGNLLATITCLFANHTAITMNFTIKTENDHIVFSATPEVKQKLAKQYSSLTQDKLIKKIKELESNFNAENKRMHTNNDKLNLLFMLSKETCSTKLNVADSVLLHRLWPDELNGKPVRARRCKTGKANSRWNKYAFYK